MWKKIKEFWKWLWRDVDDGVEIGQSASPRNTNAVMFDEFADWDGANIDILKHEPLLEQRARQLNRPEPSLPMHCFQCNVPVTPSKIDDRVVGCLHCKLMFMTPEAQNDPNIQRDITHANAGVTPKQTKMQDRISAQDVMDVLRIKHDIELGQAMAFGEGYTRGKHGMSRAEYNEKMKKEREDLENENESNK